METFVNKLEDAAKGWYKLNWDLNQEKTNYYQIFSFSSQNGGDNVMDHYFKAAVYDENGKIINQRQIIPLCNLHKLEVISKEDLPWNKQNNKPNLSSQKQQN